MSDLNERDGKKFLLLDERDNTLTALKDLEKGAILAAGESGEELVLVEAIPYAHKIARCLIPKGAKVIKYGEVIGQAVDDIPPGALVHVHNIVGLRAKGEE